MNDKNDMGIFIMLLIALFGSMIVGYGFGTNDFEVFIMGAMLLLLSIILSLMVRISKLEEAKK